MAPPNPTSRLQRFTLFVFGMAFMAILIGGSAEVYLWKYSTVSPKTNAPSKQLTLTDPATLDGYRVQDLQLMAQSLADWHVNNREFPESYSQVIDLSSSGKFFSISHTEDPATHAPYEYRTMSSHQGFELCATFQMALSSGVRLSESGDAGSKPWSHPAGHSCFEFRYLNPSSDLFLSSLNEWSKGQVVMISARAEKTISFSGVDFPDLVESRLVSTSSGKTYEIDHYCDGPYMLSDNATSVDPLEEYAANSYFCSGHHTITLRDASSTEPSMMLLDVDVKNRLDEPSIFDVSRVASGKILVNVFKAVWFEPAEGGGLGSTTHYRDFVIDPIKKSIRELKNFPGTDMLRYQSGEWNPERTRLLIGDDGCDEEGCVPGDKNLYDLEKDEYYKEITGGKCFSSKDLVVVGGGYDISEQKYWDIHWSSTGELQLACIDLHGKRQAVPYHLAK